MSTAVCADGLRQPAHRADQPDRHDQQAAEHDGRQRRQLALALDLLHALLQPGLQLVRPLARLAGVEPRVGLAGLLLLLELLGAVIPVVDFLGQPVLDRRLGLVEELELAVAHLGQMLRHHRRRSREPAPCSPGRG